MSTQSVISLNKFKVIDEAVKQKSLDLLKEIRFSVGKVNTSDLFKLLMADRSKNKQHFKWVAEIK